MDHPEAADRVRSYYRQLDADRCEQLRGLLHPAFVQVRPDRRFEDREAFIGFMRADRPIPDATHEIERLFTAVDRAGSTAIAAEGELRGPNGDRLFGFVDIHEFEDEQIVRLRTYTD